MLSEIAILVFLTPVGYSFLSSSYQRDTYCCLRHTSGRIILSPSHQWKNHSLSLTPMRIIHKKGPFTTQQKVPKIISLSSLLFTYSLCHCLNTSQILMFVSVLILNKFNLYHFTNHCVLYWLILIPKWGSLDPNLKRGTFDQSKYVRSCDVTVEVLAERTLSTPYIKIEFSKKLEKP